MGSPFPSLDHHYKSMAFLAPNSIITNKIHIKYIYINKLTMAMNTVFLLFTFSLLIMSTHSTREFPFQPLIPGLNSTGPGGEALDCLTALYRIKSCSNEILAYFAKGAIDITPPCCEAITLITHQCWPAVLSTIGYGPNQVYILRGYCDAAASYAPVFGPVLSPVGQPLSPVNY